MDSMIEKNIELCLSEEDAALLALFLKRLDSNTVRAKSQNDAEADAISGAVYALTRSLADQGFNPR